MARNSVQLKPMLLNKGDAITFKFMLSEDSFDPSVTGRIVGVSRITKIDFRSDEERRRSKLVLLISIVLFVSAVIVVILLEATDALAPMGFWRLLVTSIGVSLGMASAKAITLALQKK